MSLTARDLNEIEKNHAEGLSSRQILEILDDGGLSMSEATLRKYVQLGLLPRSKRVGVKGKHRGSHGIYPVEVIRKVGEIRRAMEAGDTLETLVAKANGAAARIDALRSLVDEVVAAAETELEGSALDRKAKGDLRGALSALGRDAKAWMRSLEKWSQDLGAHAASRDAKATDRTKTSARRGA